MGGNAVRTCVITGFGINADEELRLAFQLAGSEAVRVHVSDLIADPGLLAGFHILAFPGGFSYGDHLGSGKVFAALCRRTLRPALEAHAGRGRLIIGICNGFQVLVKMGILPNRAGAWERETSLIHNESGKFEDRWVRVSFQGSGPCVWTRGLADIDMPVRHGEGRFITASGEVLADLERRGLVALRYVSRDGGRCSYPENPNGSVADIAGISDPSGRILGLMPHPEAFSFAENHPDRDRQGGSEGAGLALFRRGVEFAREHLTGRAGA